MKSVNKVGDEGAQDSRTVWGMRMAASIAAAAGALCLCLGMPMVGYAGLALVSVIVFHISLRPSARELLLISVPSLIFWATYVVLFKIDWLHRPPAIMFLLGTMGAGSLTVLSVRAVWSQGENRTKVLRVLFPAAGMLVFLIVKNNLINVMAFQRSTFDLHLFLADGSFGFHPAMSLWKYTFTHPVVHVVIQAIYALLPVGMAFVYAPHLRKFDSKYFMLQTYFLAGFLGWLSYSIVPAAGPLFMFGGNFGVALPTYSHLKMVAVQRVELPPIMFRNAVPSLHLTWALLGWLNARKLGKPYHYLAILFTFGTVLATMGTGQHYMVDLIVAVPFTLFIQALCTKKIPNSSTRGAAITGGALLALAWMLMLRFNPTLFLANLALPWICTAATFTAVAVLFLRMEKATAGTFWPEEGLSGGKDEEVNQPAETARVISSATA